MSFSTLRAGVLTVASLVIGAILIAVIYTHFWPWLATPFDVAGDWEGKIAIQYLYGTSDSLQVAIGLDFHGTTLSGTLRDQYGDSMGIKGRIGGGVKRQSEQVQSMPMVAKVSMTVTGVFRSQSLKIDLVGECNELKMSGTGQWLAAASHERGPVVWCIQRAGQSPECP